MGKGISNGGQPDGAGEAAVTEITLRDRYRGKLCKTLISFRAPFEHLSQTPRLLCSQPAEPLLIPVTEKVKQMDRESERTRVCVCMGGGRSVLGHAFICTFVCLCVCVYAYVWVYHCVYMCMQCMSLCVQLVFEYASVCIRLLAHLYLLCLSAMLPFFCLQYMCACLCVLILLADLSLRGPKCYRLWEWGYFWKAKSGHFGWSSLLWREVWGLRLGLRVKLKFELC